MQGRVRAIVTAQVPDKIIYEGIELDLVAELNLPIDHPRIRKVRSGIIEDSSCWRGFVASWEVKSGFLFLTDLIFNHELAPGESVFADWVSETLIMPTGQITQHADVGNAEYDRWFYAEVKAGKVVRTWNKHTPAPVIPDDDDEDPDGIPLHISRNPLRSSTLDEADDVGLVGPDPRWHEDERIDDEESWDEPFPEDQETEAQTQIDRKSFVSQSTSPHVYDSDD